VTRQREKASLLQHPRCPYCHDEIAKGERPEVCAECHALHHADCYQTHGACSACGKDGVTAVRPVEGTTDRYQPEVYMPACIFESCGEVAYVGVFCRSHANTAGIAIAIVAGVGVVGLLVGLLLGML
jgi:hypothetical protein